jgi:hypothetical protein
MNVGLDLGSHTFRAVRQQGDELRARHSRAAYAVLTDSPAQRRVLEQAGIGYARCEGHLVLLGDAAAEYSQLFQVPCLPLLPDGNVPHDDPLARQVLAALVESLLPEPERPGEICCFTSPGASLGKLGPNPERLEFFAHLIRLRGYTPIPMAAGMAVVYAELVHESFNGIGITFGASSCEFSLAHQGREVCSASLPCGGDWIDEQFARQTDSYTWDSHGRQLLDLTAANGKREAFSGSLVRPIGRDPRLLAELHLELLVRVAREAAQRLASAPRIPHPHAPFHILCSGGVARIPGFRELAQEVFREIPFPVALAEIRIGYPSRYTIARGCLINAHLENRVPREHSQAA